MTKVLYIRTPEIRERLRNLHLGKKMSDEAKYKMHLSHMGVLSPRYGKHHTEESKRKMRESQLGKIDRYAKFGFDCLVIWEHEINDIDSVKNKLYLFDEYPIGGQKFLNS